MKNVIFVITGGLTLGAFQAYPMMNPLHVAAQTSAICEAYFMVSLHEAARSGNVERIRQLLATPGTDVNAIQGQGESQKTALVLAIENNHPEVVHELVKAPGIRVNDQDPFKYSPLTRAVGYGRPALVKELLQAPGIKIDIPGRFGLTPFAEAKRRVVASKNAQTLEIITMFNDFAREQARQQSRLETLQLFYALIERAGAPSQAKTLTPDFIRQIQQMLEQEEIREAVGK